MIYKFKSKAAGDLIMLGPNGDAMLRLLGREPAAKGIIECVAMPEAMAVLQSAIGAEEAARAEAEREAQAAGGELPAPQGISLRQRLWPMVEMLRRAQAHGEPIVWGV